MSIYSNVTEQDLIDLRKLAEQQKSQRVLKIKNRILKQTHDIKLAESLSPITKKIDEVKEYTEKLGEIVKESQSEAPQLTIENTPNHQPVDNNEGVIYDVELEKTLEKMIITTGFFKKYCDRERGWIWNGYPIKVLGGKEVEINDKKYNITPGIQKVLTDTSNIPIKKFEDKDKEKFNNILRSLEFDNYEAIRGESNSGRFKQSKCNFKKRDLKGQGNEKIIIPSNIFDFYTRLEVLHGLKL